MRDYGYSMWRPYVSVAQRRLQAQRERRKLEKQGHPVSPVSIHGRTIARTFWGRAWCQNLERYSDFANRLPRGRTYVRNGSVIDLQVGPGQVRALVSGSDIYTVAVDVCAVPKARWSSLCAECAGAIDSLVELLQGRFSQGVMERICQRDNGLFPAPAELRFTCSCPDWASMCKHVAAVLYGIGARLDEHPELLFKLRQVDGKDLIARAGKGIALSKTTPSDGKRLSAEGLSELFGLELAASAEEPAPRAPSPPAKPRRAVKASTHSNSTAAKPQARTRKRQTKARSGSRPSKARTQARPKAPARKRKTLRP